MDRAALRDWLLTINGPPERGSELRAAQAHFEAKGRETLTCEELIGIYTQALRDGKYWSVRHDLHACDVAWETGITPPFEASYDHVYFTPGALTLEEAYSPIDAKRLVQMRAQGQGFPNAEHPSDHLPVGATFAWSNTRS